MSYEKLISSLANQGAKAALPNPYQVALKISAALILYAALLVGLFGLRPDFSLKIKEFSFFAEIFISILAIFSAATALAFLRLPNFSDKFLSKNLSPAFFVIFTFFVSYHYFFRADNDSSLALCGVADYRCLLAIIIFSAIPALFLLRILRQGVMTNFYFSALMIGISSGVLSYLIERLIHETESFDHLFIWHFLPVFIVIFLSLILTNFTTKKL